MLIAASTSNGGACEMQAHSRAAANGRSESAEECYALQLAVAARRAAIRLHAYYRAERRGFVAGHELEDWLAAERQMAEIDATREEQYQGRGTWSEPSM
jgi:hypothetical protein